MITAEYLGFLGSIYPSLLGILIVFSSLVFIACYVIVVTKVIAMLEKSVLKKPETAKPVAKKAPVAKKDNSEDAKKVAIIASAIAQERRAPIDSFVITSIKKI